MVYSKQDLRTFCTSCSFSYLSICKALKHCTPLWKQKDTYFAVANFWKQNSSPWKENVNNHKEHCIPDQNMINMDKVREK